MDAEVGNPKSQDSKSKIQDSKRIQLAVVVALAVVVLGFGVWGFGFSRSRADEVWARVQSQRVFTVATDASYPPFSALDENGNLFGFEIDLAEEIGRRWGVRVDFENITYDALLGAVISGRDDAIISGFVPQPGRLKEVSFTHPYFVAGTVAVMQAADDGRWTVEESGGWAQGLTLAVEYGAGGDALARQWKRRVANISLLPKPTAAEALLAVENGEAQAALVDAVSAYDFLLGHPALKLAGPPLEPEPYTIAVSARSHTLFRELESVLQALEADGTLPALRVKWFGESGKQ